MISCKEENPISKEFDKYLNKKYQLILSRYQRLESDSEIKKQAEQDFRTSDLPGAYWAVVSHPYHSTKLINYLFGKIHMMSHLNGFTNRNHQRKIIDLEKKCQELENAKRNYRQVIKDLKSKLQKSKSQSKAKEYIIEETVTEKAKILYYKERIYELENGIDLKIIKKELQKEQKKYLKEEQAKHYYQEK